MAAPSAGRHELFTEPLNRIGTRTSPIIPTRDTNVSNYFPSRSSPAYPEPVFSSDISPPPPLSSYFTRNTPREPFRPLQSFTHSLDRSYSLPTAASAHPVRSTPPYTYSARDPYIPSAKYPSTPPVRDTYFAPVSVRNSGQWDNSTFLPEPSDYSPSPSRNLADLAPTRTGPIRISYREPTSESIPVTVKSSYSLSSSNPPPLLSSSISKSDPTVDPRVTVNNNNGKLLNVNVGLINPLGAQNCFLNVIIQALWHLDSFRSKYATVPEHSHSQVNPHCITCDLKTLFRKYEMTGTSEAGSMTVAPDSLRFDLDYLYEGKKFRMGEMADATEAFIAMLNAIHASSLPVQMNAEEAESVPCTPLCVAHSIFWCSFCEQESCRCGATSEVQPYDFSTFTFNAYISELFNPESDQFYTVAEYLHKLPAALARTVRTKKNSCVDTGSDCPFNQTIREMYIMNSPEVFTVGLVWPESRPPIQLMIHLLASLTPVLNLKQIFRSSVEDPLAYEFRGMVCYYGMHYIAFFRSNHLFGQWIMFNDSQVEPMGAWNRVVEKCLRERCHPTILFFERCSESSCRSAGDMDMSVDYWTDLERRKLAEEKQLLEEQRAEEARLEAEESRLKAELPPRSPVATVGSPTKEAGSRPNLMTRVGTEPASTSQTLSPSEQHNTAQEMEDEDEQLARKMQEEEDRLAGITGDVWQCRFCTLFNSPDRITCSACKHKSLTL
eukprot:GILK01014338.1.p1 GENE.GILK01014338.1~~GILK01014338.1.p1  ORF type:complete len:801 (+),score=115.39 GILK01014338.1:238-2403(+)